MFRELQSNIGTIWCNMTHKSVMWPTHGHYECRTCGRHYPAFAGEPIASATERRAWKPAVQLLLAMALLPLARPAHAAEIWKGQAAVAAQATLERFTSGGGFAPWAVESVEIHACLPKLEKTGELRAIRRLAPIGESKYEVLQLAGDRTVKEQVIVRYLSAEQRASETPPASVAITPVNYKFVFKGAFDDGERRVYVFQITPRHKRDGLIKGELWLDQQTAVPVLQSGRLVKSPSLFIRRVFFTRENALRDGAIESRLTHITVETRLVGRAELVVEERPLQSTDHAQLVSWDNRGGGQ